MAEREMSLHQRSLIDNCFEEGHYLQGIAYLDQLRVVNLRPSPAHIRQLIYISLTPPSRVSERAKEKRREQPPGIASPSRTTRYAKGIQKQSLLPPPEAGEAAWRLLHDFVDTVSPEALLRAIPCYPPSEAELSAAPRLVDAKMFNDVEVKEDLDSYVAKEATKLCDCRDCWSMLRPNVAGRSAIASRLSDPFLDGDGDDDDSSSSNIGNNSWFLLDWLVKLFEKDQALSEDTKARYSLYLLSQIRPAPASTGATRPNAEAALDIAFTCYAQTSPIRRKLGRRLVALLISLASSQSLSAGQLLASICTHLIACSWDTLSAFLQDLPRTDSGLAFKAALCDRYLTQNLRGNVETGAGQRNASSVKPQARRAKPAPAPDNANSLRPETQESRQQKSHPWTLPAASRILQHVKLLDVNLVRLTVLFHLVDAFGSMKGAIGTDNEDGQSWSEALRSGELEDDIKLKFTAAELSNGDIAIAQGQLASLLYSCSSWRQNLN